MEYLFIKWLHIVNATVLVGLGLGSAFYFFVTAMAYQRGQPAELMAHVARWVVRADAWFIAPAVIIQPVTGLWMIYLGNPDVLSGLSQAWLWQSLLLYGFAGACWLPVLWLQVRMRDLALADSEQERFKPYFRYWTLLGIPAFSAMALVYGLMVMKIGF